MSVGAVTITEGRKDVLDFTQPYAYSPAQMTATDGVWHHDPRRVGRPGHLRGCGTTYQQWIEGTLVLVDAPPPATPPAGATAFPLDTDLDCVLPVQNGRPEFVGWLSSADTIEPALASGLPMVEVGDPVFYESLGVAFDKSGRGQRLAGRRGRRHRRRDARRTAHS